MIDTRYIARNGWTMIPVLSFLASRGQCRKCGAALPGWLLGVEIAASAAGVLAVLAGGGPVIVWLSAVWLWLLIALALSDLIWFRLPDLLVITLGVTALGWAASPVGQGLLQAVLGAAIGSGTFLALRLGYRALRGREGLGLGDVKLMAPLGAWAGPLDIPLLVLISALLALGTILLAWMRRALPIEAQTAVPFGAALCGGASILWLVRALG